jgi:hypothetical protein
MLGVYACATKPASRVMHVENWACKAAYAINESFSILVFEAEKYQNTKILIPPDGIGGTVF